ncbi:MAG TPA: hypothetical protein VNW51_00065 [Mucilaginibacter sp.]|jgi:hypothetical protein|nr:hypothetical protein [Mucilaginibacter sp.]
MHIQPLNKFEGYIAYFKYKGELVQDGYLDARKAADAIIGIDEVMRYFIMQSDKQLAQVDFEIPIKVQKGSWEALIPHNLGDWLATCLGSAAVAYATTAVHKIAENDFENVKTKDIVKGAIKAIKWVLLVSKHMGSIAIDKFREVKFDSIDNTEEQLIGLENEQGEVLYVPYKYIEAYRNCPEKLFDKLMRNLTTERDFEVGLNPIEPIDKDDTPAAVTVSHREKYIFINEARESDLVLPELIHGTYVELEGHVTRGNENANTIGFEYLGHVITCSPISGNVKDYKSLLFTNCLIKGEVDRSKQSNWGNDRRPHIKFVSLQSVRLPGEQHNLFDDQG